MEISYNEAKDSNKKNIIFILVDGLSESMIDEKVSGKYVCPYLHALGENNMRFHNVYSQGTYTMSAINSLFTGEDTIHDNIYDSFFSSHKKCVFDEFFEQSYETFITMLGFSLPSSHIVEKADHLYLFDEEDAFRYYKYLIDYYKKIEQSEKDITNYDYCRLEYFFDSLFKGTECLFFPSSSVVNLWRNVEYPWESYRALYNQERNKYLTDKRNYISSLLRTDSEWIAFDDLFRVKNDYLSADSLTIGSLFFNQNSKRINRCRKKQIFHSVLYNGLPISAYWDYLIKCKLEGQLSSPGKEKLISYTMRTFGDCNTRNVFSKNSRENKGLIVAENMLNAIACDLKKRKKGKPFFVFIHLEDTHQPFDCFSLLDERSFYENAELSIELSNSVDLHDSYSGSYSYLLSASYVDRQIQNFLEKIKKQGDLDNTVMIITSDHGTVFGNSPIRGLSQANNIHKEGYHVPCIMVDFSSHKEICSYDFFESKDIFSTIFSLAHINVNNSYDGINMIIENSRGYAHSEHLGSGVADIYRKPVIYTIRNNNFLLCIKSPLEKGIQKDSVEMIFDLNLDEKELHNKKNDLIDAKEIDLLLDIIRYRHEDVRKEYSRY